MSLDPGALLNAIVSGQDVETPAPESAAPSTEPAVEEDTNPASTLDEWQAEGNQEASDSEKPLPEETPKDEEKPEEEYIVANGKKLKVDYSDKAKIKKAYEMAAGMRKFQKERDDFRRERDELKSEVAELKGLWSKIEDAAEREDHNELMKIMTAGKYDLDTLLETKLARAKAREEATEEEIAQMDLQEKIAALEARLAKTDSKMAEKLEEASRFKEEAELKSLESKIHPAFNQYRFAGKLGDADAEHHLDEMLWTKALSNLEQYDEVTHEAIVKEFSAVAKTLDKVINKKVESKTKEVSKERKRNAKTTAQMQQVRGYVDSDLKKEAATKIRSGNLTDILKNWDRFGKLF